MGVQINEDRYCVVELTINPAALGTGPSVGEQTFSCPGVKVGDIVVPIKPSFTAAMTCTHARVSASDTLALTFVASAGTPDAGSEAWRFLIFRPEKVFIGHAVL